MLDHPIPQDIVGYRFHIVGNMTLKQFAEIGAGCVLAFLVYKTNLAPYIKWPLVFTSFAVGAIAAFVPFEERPFDHWLVTFFGILYKPTKFFWKREPHVPDPFNYKADPNADYTGQELDMTPLRRQRIKEYLFSIQGQPQLDAYETAEQVHINSIMSAFNNVRVTEVSIEKNVERPSLKVRPHQLKSPQINPTVPVFTIDKVVPAQAQVSPHQSQITHTPLAPEFVAQDIEIPEYQTVSIDPAAPENQQLDAQSAHAEERAYVEAQQSVGVTATESVLHNQDLPFPEPPDIPNKLVGMVLSPTNDLINDAIVEIQMADGRVARAVKTNALGQFYVTTPLENGEYNILVDKDGFAFTPQQLVLQGDLVPPIEIRSVA